MTLKKAEELLAGFAERAFAGKSETLRAPAGVDPDRLADALMERFGSDDALEAIEIVLGDESVGYVRRGALYGLVGALSKSIGAGDHGSLPGAPDYHLITLGCPVLACDYRLSTMIYDEDHPPMCARHPGTALSKSR